MACSCPPPAEVHYPQGSDGRTARPPPRASGEEPVVCDVPALSPSGGASVRPVLSLLVLLILFLVGALGAEPLHFLWRCCHYSNTGPVVPVITVIAADHGTPIIWLVASRTDPDLIPPLISDLRFLNSEGEKPEMEWGKRTKKRAG